jgi:hypothetical protein
MMKQKQKGDKMTTAQAEKDGYKPITYAYGTAEQHMLDKVEADMKRGNVDFVLVETEEGKEVWRK